MHKIKANLHVHSYHSDGIHSPWVIVQSAKLFGIKVLSITDHNEIAGSLRGAIHAERAGLIFFPGIELMFRVGAKAYEMLAYFYDSKSATDFFNEYRYHNGFWPHFKSVKDVVDLIRKHDGAVVAPHPFGHKGIFRNFKHRELDVDGIELLNAFTGEKMNLAAKYHRYGDNCYVEMGAADMHFFLDDLNKVYTELTSKKEITKKEIWENLTTKKKTITFKPVGDFFSEFKVFIQKPLCTVVYMVNYPRLYMSYFLGKRKGINSSALKDEYHLSRFR